MSAAVEPHMTPAADGSLMLESEQSEFWRPLFYFNVYRLAGAVVLLVMVTVWGSSLQFGSRDYALFVWLTGFYCLFSLLCLFLRLIRLIRLIGLPRLRWLGLDLRSWWRRWG